MKLAKLSKAQLVSCLRESFPRGERAVIGIGDDCTRVVTPEESFIITTDVMVEDQYFHLSWSTGYEVDARVTTQNLADIDAMGGRSSALVTSVVVPCDMDSNAFLDVVRGLRGRTRKVGAGVVGGDLSVEEKLVISITIFGYCPDPVMHHGDARPEDVATVSDTPGYSYAGPDFLGGGHIDPSSQGVEQLGELAPFTETYHAPRPPLDSGIAAAITGAHTMMDLSDGPTADARHTAQASDVVVELNRGTIEAKTSQLTPATRVCAVSPMRQVLQGGEEHGVVAIFPLDALLPGGLRVVDGVRACRPGEGPQAMIDGAVLYGAQDHFSADPVDQCDVGRWSLC